MLSFVTAKGQIHTMRRAYHIISKPITLQLFRCVNQDHAVSSTCRCLRHNSLNCVSVHRKINCRKLRLEDEESRLHCIQIVIFALFSHLPRLAYFSEDYAADSWPTVPRSEHELCKQPGIAWQELFALVVACHLWGSIFSNERILFFCDNKSVVDIVNSKRSRIPRVMDLVRHLTLLTLRYNFYLKVQHIEGKRNVIADSISRFQMERFRMLAPHADPAPTPVPQELWEI